MRIVLMREPNPKIEREEKHDFAIFPAKRNERNERTKINQNRFTSHFSSLYSNLFSISNSSPSANFSSLSLNFSSSQIFLQFFFLLFFSFTNFTNQIKIIIRLESNSSGGNSSSNIYIVMVWQIYGSAEETKTRVE